MSAILPSSGMPYIRQPHFEDEPEHKKAQRKIVRRVIYASIVALALHLFFFFGLAPFLKLYNAIPSRTEVVQISPSELAKMKKEILKNKYLPPLLKQELHEEFKTKERPKDAQYMGAFNQTVPKQQTAGPQPDQPLDGGGGAKARQKAASKPQEQLNLAKLGLGNKIAPPPKPEQASAQDNAANQESFQGRPGPHRPVGRLDKDLPRGNENLLNAAENEYYSFFARFEEPIIRNWFFLLRSNDGRIKQEMASHKVQAGAELPITVEFVLKRDGSFEAINLIESSGITTLDWATRESVKKLGSLPNPPAGLFDTGQYFSYRLKFMVHVNDAIVSNPGLEWY